MQLPHIPEKYLMNCYSGLNATKRNKSVSKSSVIGKTMQ